MKVKSSSFDNLPFSKLFRDYTSGTGTIYHFFESERPDINALAHRSKKLDFGGDRKKTVELLTLFNKQFDAPPKTLEKIKMLANPNSVTIVTGQQVTLLGGPLFTIYKTLTAIHYARALEKETGFPVVPVFWLADEDHDVEEASQITLLNRSDSVALTYKLRQYSDDPPTAASLQLGNEFEQFRQKLSESLEETDFTEQLLEQADRFYQKEHTFGYSFGRWLLHLFSDEGLVLAGSNTPEMKQHSVSLFETAVKERKQISVTLDDATYDLIEHGYHGQVQVQSSNLFYFDDDGSRHKLQFTNETWNIPNRHWSTEELLNEIEERPARFSPNVFLRPILQDHILPVAGYVGGPGEIAYYAQMKSLYPVFGKTMPVIIPRFSITLFDTAIDRIIDKLPFRWTQFSKRLDDLEKLYVQKSEKADIEQMFSAWRSHIEEFAHAQKKEIGKIDPTLTGSVGKAKAAYLSELDKVKGKVYRSVKDQNKIQIDRIQRIRQTLFPNGNLQERELAFIFFMNKYGMQLWDRILTVLEDEDPFTHKEIHL